MRDAIISSQPLNLVVIAMSSAEREKQVSAGHSSTVHKPKQIADRANSPGRILVSPARVLARIFLLLPPDRKKGEVESVKRERHKPSDSRCQDRHAKRSVHHPKTNARVSTGSETR